MTSPSELFTGLARPRCLHAPEWDFHAGTIFSAPSSVCGFFLGFFFFSSSFSCPPPPLY